jgi:hypothetical protein
MVNKKLIENVEYLTAFYYYGFENQSCSYVTIKNHISDIAIEIKKCINHFFWQNEYEMLGKLLNRFDNALERWEKKEKTESDLEDDFFTCIIKDHPVQENFPNDFLVEQFSEIKVAFIKALKNDIESYKIGSYNTESHRAPSETIQAKYKLHPKKNDKTDLIRILNAVYELKIIYKSDLVLPTKDEFMRDMGNVFGEDFSTYSKNLSQAYGGSLESNLKVFETMLENTRKAFEEKLDKKK